MSATRYRAFADAYDAIMQDVPYAAWWAFVEMQLRARGGLPAAGAAVLELGCGTGNATALLAHHGWRVLAVDASEQMLAIASRKLLPVEFVAVDIRHARFDAHRFSLVVAIYDVMNHLLDAAELRNVANMVHAALQPGGWWVFDLNTASGLRDPWLGEPLEGVADGVHFRIEHSWQDDTQTAHLDAWWARDGVMQHEQHQQRAYAVAEVVLTLEMAGFEGVEALREPSGEKADEDDARVWVFAKRPS